MLRSFTEIDIVYLYSETDTPGEFVREIANLGAKPIGFNDDGITFNVREFQSAYTSFNTLRTCDFIFAYNLTQYDKICIVESDLVIMRSIDSVFDLKAPSIFSYSGEERYYNQPTIIEAKPIEQCEKSTLNGGVMLIEPSRAKFQECLNALPIIIANKCKYPNESLFEYVNPVFNRLPIEYNLTHYRAFPDNLRTYGIEYTPTPTPTSDVRIFHFNETDFKHLDIVKDTWFRDNIKKPHVAKKYAVKRIPIEYFDKNYYRPNRDKVNRILLTLNKQRGGTRANKNKKRLSGTRRLAARKR
jgi:alpha-N-acetylglucosamine transferase